MTFKRIGFAFCCLLCSLAPAHAQDGLAKIKTIVVIYAENRSFDHLYGAFPGANGIANATAEQKTQLDHDGTPLPQLTIFGGDGKPDPRFPKMPNAPFRINAPPINGRPDMILPNPSTPFITTRSRSTADATTCSLRCRMSADG